MSATSGLLKMSELAERSAVSAGTIKHYLREGLLGSQDDVLRTSRNMAYYPEEFVERIRLIKRLQEERFMPLRVIREVMSEDPERAARMIELEDRILERATEAGETGRVSRTRVRETYDLPRNVGIKLNDKDISRAKELMAYPWFQKKEWQVEIKRMLTSGLKFELDALANKDFQYLTKQYLPRKLKDRDWLD